MIKPSDSTFPAPTSSPPPREAEAFAPVPNHTPERACDTPVFSNTTLPLRSLPKGGGREPLPTDNSHFFAARFRNTPGPMPSGELCNQGHRSRAKQTRLCVCVQRRPRGSAPGREGLRPGLGLGSWAPPSRLSPAPSGDRGPTPPPPPPPPQAGELRPESPSAAQPRPTASAARARGPA